MAIHDNRVLGLTARWTRLLARNEILERLAFASSQHRAENALFRPH